jgi:peptidoglycan-associated lipoprotein
MKERTMKLNKFTNLLVIGLVLCVAAVGCKSKKPVNVTDLPNSKAGPPKGPESAGPISPEKKPGSESLNPNENPTAFPLNPDLKNWIPDTETLRAQTVYFDFDSSVVKVSEKSKVAAVADYAKANSGKAVRVEGNCDERGTEEYNRSLGERRALAVREELIRLGIDPNKIDTTSYGKDKPAVQGHNEAAWSKNRRDDFVVLTKPGS